MLAQERYTIILEMLAKDKIVKVPELCKRFSVSFETVRRDLEFLEQGGKLKRVYGGAIPHANNILAPYHTRYTQNAEAKVMIGKHTAELVLDGETLMIDHGTTTLEVARHLKNKKDLTVITNSILVAQELVDVPTFHIILPGGVLRAKELTLSGHISKQFMRELNVDKAIIGVGGITVDQGITNYHLDDNRIRKVMIEKGDQIIAVADHSKFGVKTLGNVCSLDEVDVIVTDDKVSHATAEAYSDEGIKIVGHAS